MSLEQGPSQTLTRVMPSYRRHLLQTKSQVLPIPLLLEKLAAAPRWIIPHHTTLSFGLGHEKNPGLEDLTASRM